MKHLALLFSMLVLAAMACGPTTRVPTPLTETLTPLASPLPTADLSALWYLTRGDAKSDQAWGVDTDSQGNVYIAAYMQQPPSRLFFDMVIYKFSPDGKELWQTQWGGDLQEKAFVVTVSEPDLYVGGLAHTAMAWSEGEMRRPTSGSAATRWAGENKEQRKEKDVSPTSLSIAPRLSQARGYLLNTIEYYRELEGRTDEIDAMRYEDDYLHFGGYKFLLDGAVAAAYTHEPHNGIVWDMPTWRVIPLKQAVSMLHEMGYQCSFHCIGDAAVDMALDAIEYAMNQHPRSDPRHRLEHAVLNTPSALQRTRDLGVVVSTQPHGIRLLGDELIEMWGEERAMRIIPTRTWLDLGVPLSLSSDCPTLPWWQPPMILSAAVTRLSPSNRVIGPDQVLTIEEAMRAYTMGGAYACFEEHIKGSLEPGKFADLIVWRLDPYITTLPDMMKEHPVDLTMVGGKVVFERQWHTYLPAVKKNRP
jgi:hypothetical protein